MEEHEVFNNIEMPLQFMGRNINDWIGSMLASFLMASLVYKPLTQNDIISGLLFAATGWGLMTTVTWYRDNFPPHLLHYALKWISQGDVYEVRPDPVASPVLRTREMIEREEQRARELQVLTAAAQEERAARRRERSYDARELRNKAEYNFDRRNARPEEDDGTIEAYSPEVAEQISRQLRQNQTSYEGQVRPEHAAHARVWDHAAEWENTHGTQDQSGDQDNWDDELWDEAAPQHSKEPQDDPAATLGSLTGGHHSPERQRAEDQLEAPDKSSTKQSALHPSPSADVPKEENRFRRPEAANRFKRPKELREQPEAPKSEKVEGERRGQSAGQKRRLKPPPQ